MLDSKQFGADFGSGEVATGGRGGSGDGHGPGGKKKGGGGETGLRIP